MSRVIDQPRIRRRQAFEAGERSIVSALDKKRRAPRIVILVLTVVLLVAVTIACVGPLVWLFKAATSTSNEILANPFSLWPTGLR